MKIKINFAILVTLSLIITGLFFLSLLGFTGLRTMIGVILYFVLPSYLVMRRWFDPGESLFFGFFVGIGLFSALVYYVGFVTGLQLGVILVFSAVVGAALFYKTDSTKEKKKIVIPVAKTVGEGIVNTKQK